MARFVSKTRQQKKYVTMEIGLWAFHTNNIIDSIHLTQLRGFVWAFETKLVRIFIMTFEKICISTTMLELAMINPWFAIGNRMWQSLLWSNGQKYTVWSWKACPRLDHIPYEHMMVPFQSKVGWFLQVTSSNTIFSIFTKNAQAEGCVCARMEGY